MNSVDLKFFQAVVRANSMGGAAEVLHTVQSNVTARIKSLEEEIGAPLFHRSRRGVTLTATGIQLVPYAERVGELLDEAKRVVTDRDTPSGLLRIGSMETTAALRLPPILIRYAEEYPEVDVLVEASPTEQLGQRGCRSQTGWRVRLRPHRSSRTAEPFDYRRGARCHLIAAGSRAFGSEGVGRIAGPEGPRLSIGLLLSPAHGHVPGVVRGNECPLDGTRNNGRDHRLRRRRGRDGHAPSGGRSGCGSRRTGHHSPASRQSAVGADCFRDAERRVSLRGTSDVHDGGL